MCAKEIEGQVVCATPSVEDECVIGELSSHGYLFIRITRGIVRELIQIGGVLVDIALERHG